MAIKNDKHDCIWSNSDFDLEEEFGKGSFEELIKYSDTNELNLMRIWLSGNQSDIRNVLRLGTVLLSYFERSISEDSKSLTAFKLGELSGHLECLDGILYETDQNTLAKAKLETVKLMHPKYSNHLENIIVALSNENGIATEQELLKKVPLNLQELKNILNVLLENKFIHYYKGMGYSLSTTGIRLAKQLTETSN